MKAPNKIYVEVCEDGIFAFPKPPFKESVEYIRADIIEQAIQQEQPEVDLQKEIENYYYDNFAFISSAHTPTKDIVSDIANHFYELGLNTRCEE